MPDFWTIFLAAIGFGAAGEALRRYRGFKARRKLISPQSRNAGFWTDGRIYHAEAAFSAVALSIPFSAITLAIWTNGRISLVALSLVIYALAIYLLMVALNAREPQ